MAITMDKDGVTPLRWLDGALLILDQSRLPGEEIWIRCTSAEEVAQAIRGMCVRGAPAIGCAAAYGIALAWRELVGRRRNAGLDELVRELDRASDHLAATRPTAVNLSWALAQMRAAALQQRAAGGDAVAIATALENRAVALQAEDVAMCRRIGEHGAPLIEDGATVLTHCNAGALATGGYGTALGVLRRARCDGKRIRVLADETRPYLQGSRLTAWELAREGFDVTVIPDGSAAFLLSRGEIDCVLVGADRIAANGDVANKIGTYAIALAAQAHDVPFYVAAPRSTVDAATATGATIPIEERSGAEVLAVAGVPVAPPGVGARYPAFDITPAALVTGIVTDAGIARPPYRESLAKILAAG